MSDPSTDMAIARRGRIEIGSTANEFYVEDLVVGQCIVLSADDLRWLLYCAIPAALTASSPPTKGKA